jgi:hypothetical protein
MAGPSVRGNCVLSCIRIAIALGTVAIVAGGCAGSSNTTSAQGEQSYKTIYGLSSEGPTTDLYTEIFGPRQPPPAPAATVAAAQPTQPVTNQPVAPVQQAQVPSSSGRQVATTRQNQTAAGRTPQPTPIQPAPVQVAQQPAPPPPPEPDVPTAYGITANGPTTDLYTMIFGPRRSEGQ